MMHRKLTIALAGAALAVSGAALAEGPAWTYLQGQYIQGDTPSDGSNDRAGIAGSAELFNILHLGGTWNTGDIEDSSSDSDIDFWEINAGAHVGVSDSADVYAEAIFGNVDVDEADDGDYIGGAFGVRVMLTDNLELNGGAEVLQVDDEAFGCSGSSCDDSTETSLFIGGRYNFTPNFSFGVEAVESNVRMFLEDSVGFDLRWAFGDQSWLGNN